MINETSRQIDRRTAIRRGAAVVGSFALAPLAAACEDPGRYTISTDPRRTTTEQIDQVRKATAGHGETTFQQVHPSSTEIWRPTMAEAVHLGETNLVQSLGFLGLDKYRMHLAELRVMQDHLLRAEEKHQYRAFIVDSQGRIMRINYTGMIQADRVFAAKRLDPNHRRNAVVTIGFETPYNESALAVASQGLELHLETVDAEFPHNHYAYQSTKVTPVKP